MTTIEAPSEKQTDPSKLLTIRVAWHENPDFDWVYKPFEPDSKVTCGELWLQLQRSHAPHELEWEHVPEERVVDWMARAKTNWAVMWSVPMSR